MSLERVPRLSWRKLLCPTQILSYEFIIDRQQDIKVGGNGPLDLCKFFFTSL